MTPAPQPSQITDEEIEHRFGYHRATFPKGYDPTNGDQRLVDFYGVKDAEGNVATAAIHAVVREVYTNAAKAITHAVPAGRELALALTALQESAMWANAGVAMQSPLIRE